jgi:hypothetical protein
MNRTMVLGQSGNGNGLSGINGIHTLLGWLMWAALTVCAASFILSAAGLAWAYYTSRPGMAANAKVGLAWSLGGAFFIGVAVALVNALYRV